MEEFDIIVFGTSIQDSLDVRQYLNLKVLVVDDKETFGDGLIHKGYVIDKLPILMRVEDPLISKINDMKMHVFIDYVNISNHLYLYMDNDNIKYHTIPTSKNELAKCDFISNKDKLLLNKLIIGTFNDIKKLDELTRHIFKQCLSSGKDNLPSFQRYINSFNHYQLLYPVYGYKEICENIIRCNAINGVTYLLDPLLRVETSDNITKLTSQYGSFVTKRFIDNRKKKHEKQAVRVICYSKLFILPSFYGVFDFQRLIHCVCLDHKTKVCPKNTCLIYLWIHNDQITDVDVKEIGIESNHVLESIDFYTDEFAYDSYDWDRL